MKKGLLMLLLFLLLSSLTLAGCGDDDDDDDPSSGQTNVQTDFEIWAARDAVWPEWAEEEQPAVLDDNFKTMYRTVARSACTSYEGMKTGVKQLRYLVNHYPDEPLRDYVRLAMARYLERLREDHLAYKEIKAIQETGKTSVQWTENRDLYFANYWHTSLIGILSRNGFTDEMEAEIAALDVHAASETGYSPGYFLPTIVRAYYITGMKEKALERIAAMGDDSLYTRKIKKASTTAGIASILFRMGEYEKLLEMTQWMIDKGYAGKDYITNPQSSYQKDQWRSCYRQVEEWRKLAQNGKPPQLSPIMWKTTATLP